MVSRFVLRFTLLALLFLTFLGVWSHTAHATPLTQLPLLHVDGDHLVDPSNTPVTLRGTELDTPLMNWNQWNSYENGDWLSDTTHWPLNTIFQQMNQDWHMNVVRIPTSPWLWSSNQSTYISQLQTVVQDATSNNLYVVLGMHDDGKAGSQYNDCANYPKQLDVNYWSAVATTFNNNPVVLYDVFNEPNYLSPSWNVWLNGGNGPTSCTQYGGLLPPVVGMPSLIQALRFHNAIGVAIVEPGNADNAPGDNAETGGWENFPINSFTEGDVMFSVHVYQGITDSTGNVDPTQLNLKWGPLLGGYPTYYGEWAFLGDGKLDHCPTSLSGNTTYSANLHEADGDVDNFMTYMARAGTGVSASNWTAWQFAQNELLQDDYQTYTPSTFPSGPGTWTCPYASGIAGMGADVQNYLSLN